MNLVDVRANKSIESAQLSLLKWVTERQFFSAPVSREVRFFDHSFFRITIGIKRPLPGLSDLSGCGRHRDLSTALSKAYGEGIERLVALEAQNEDGFCATHTVRWQNDAMAVDRAPTEIPMPPRRLRTTNGWAVHFNRETAILNAFHEAIERHLLLLCFLRLGWKGFELGPPIAWDDLEMLSLAGKFRFCGQQAGMVATKVRNHPGYTFGYFCDSVDQFAHSPSWIHAMMESYEPAKFYENIPATQVAEEHAAETNPMDRTQLRYILEKDPFANLVHQTPSSVLDLTPASSTPLGHLVVVDIAKKWNLDFELFGAFIFGQRFIPLYFKETLDSDSRDYLDRVLKTYALTDIPDVHPIL
jgi:hypothetical protein